MGIEPSVLGGSLLNLYWMERHVPFPKQRQILIKKNLEDHYQSGLFPADLLALLGGQIGHLRTTLLLSFLDRLFTAYSANIGRL